MTFKKGDVYRNIPGATCTILENPDARGQVTARFQPMDYTTCLNADCLAKALKENNYRKVETL